MSESSVSSAVKLDPISEFVKALLFLLSNPLYFSYFIFFSPYLYKLFSFLSPLFVTTTLLVLALVTTTALTPSLVRGQDIDDIDSDDEGFRLFEELDVYKVVFEYDSSALEIEEDFDDSEVVKEITCSEEKCSTLDSLQSPKDEISPKETEQDPKTTITKLEAFDSFEDSDEIEAPREEEKMSPESGFEDKYSAIKPSTKYCSRAVDSPRRITSNGANGLGSFGSTRSEKEWTRTLACKLFEERHSKSAVGGSEGMDLLWETYESESNKSQVNKMRINSTKIKEKKSDHGDNESSDYLDHEEEEEDCEDDERNGQLCCLQALKFSASKMPLGIGKPNLVKFSKAFKGFGWIHNVARNSKKKNINKR